MVMIVVHLSLLGHSCYAANLLQSSMLNVLITYVSKPSYCFELCFLIYILFASKYIFETCEVKAARIKQKLA